MNKETFKKDFLVFFFLRGLQGALGSSIITFVIRNFGTDKHHIHKANSHIKVWKYTPHFLPNLQPPSYIGFLDEVVLAL